MAFKMKGMKFKSPAKHSNPHSMGHGAERGVTEEDYKNKHPGPGTPDTKGYHVGHKGSSPIYPTSAATIVKKGISKIAATVKGKNK